MYFNLFTRLDPFTAAVLHCKPFTGGAAEPTEKKYKVTTLALACWTYTVQRTSKPQSFLEVLLFQVSENI